MIRTTKLLGLLTLCMGALSVLSGCPGDNNTPGERTACIQRVDCPEGQRCGDDNFCTSDSKSCTRSNECSVDEYCSNGTCQPSACTTDSECTSGNICRQQSNGQGLCGVGCRTNDGCGDGEACNLATFTCEVAGCTPSDCDATTEICDDTLTPAACRRTGSCATQLDCTLYARQINDGNEYICNTEQSRCEIKPPCESDSDCREDQGEICDTMPDPNVCRVGCREDSDCLPSQLCDQNSLLCVAGCSSSADCKAIDANKEWTCEDKQCIELCDTQDDCPVPGMICTGAPAICQGCVDDSQCFANQFCDKTLGATPADVDDPNVGLCVQLPPDCPADAYGDNHSRQNAFTIPALPFVTDGAMGGTAQPLFCRENSGGEWFQFTVSQANQIIDITLEYDNSSSNLGIALFNNSGNELVASERLPDVDGGVERIRFGADFTGNVYLQVRGSSSNQKGFEYKLSINVADPVACADDTFEENDTPTTAVDLPVATAHTGMQVCGDDPDYFRIQADANQIVTVSLQAPLALGDLNLTVTKEGSTVPVAQASTRADIERAVFVTEEAGTYIVQPTIARGVGNVDYTIEWTQRANECSDAYEQNDFCSLVTAKPALASQLYENLNICSANDDWYRVDLIPQQTLNVEVRYPKSAAGLIALRLFQDDCQSIIQYPEPREEPGGNQYLDKLSYTAPQGGTFYVKLELEQGPQAPYTMNIDLQDGPPCTDDVFEGVGNDSAATAAVIDAAAAATGGENALVGMRVCDLDKDYYGISLSDGDTIRWEVRHLFADGDLDAFIIDPDGATIRVPGTSTTDNETVEYTVPAGGAGVYYLLVEGGKGRAVRNSYRVLTYLNGVGPANPDCPDDLELNNTRETASQVGEGTYNLLVCGQPLDDDWFTTCIKAGETLKVDMTLDPTLGNIDIFLYDDRPGLTAPVSRGQGNTGVKTVSYTTPRDQCLSYRVFTAASVPSNFYQLDVSVQPAAACGDDSLETPGNDTPGAATPITAPGLYPTLYKCDRDQDWFALDVLENTQAEVYLNYVATAAPLKVYLYPAGQTDFPMLTNNTSPRFTDEDFATKAAAGDTVRVEYVNDAGVTVHTVDVASVPADGAWAVRPTITLASGTYTIRLTINAGAAGEQVESHTLMVNAAQGEGLRWTAADDAGTATNTTRQPYLVRVESAVPARLGYDLLAYADEDGDGTFAGPEDRVCPDAYENNDTLATPRALPVGAYGDLRLCWQGGGLNDEDYYSIFVPAGATVTAKATFVHDSGNLNLTLYRASSPVANGASSTSINNQEIVTHTNAGLGETYVVRVFGTGATPFTTFYDLELSLSFGTPCTDDATAGVDAASAATITANTYPSLTLCEGTEDWFKIAATSGELIDVGLELTNRFGDVDVELYAADGTTLLASSATATNIERIQHTAAATGDYLLRVLPKNGGFLRNDYDLWLAVGAAAPPVPFCPDPYERNDTSLSAATLNFSATSIYTDMIACGADDDWYAVSLLGGTPHDLRVYFDQTAGVDLDIEVVDTAGTVVASQSTQGNDEFLTFSPPATGTYYLGVKNVSATPGMSPYFLTFNRASAACVDDSYENNNNQFQAKALPDGPGTYTLASCGGPANSAAAEDYFTVKPTADGPLTVTVMHDPAKVDLGMAVDGNLATKSGNRITYTIPNAVTSQSYTIYIGFISGEGTYFLNIEQ